MTGKLNPRFSPRVDSGTMSSPLSRFVRMLMLALVLGLAYARPAAAAGEAVSGDTKNPVPPGRTTSGITPRR